MKLKIDMARVEARIAAFLSGRKTCKFGRECSVLTDMEIEVDDMQTPICNFHYKDLLNLVATTRE